MLAKFFIMASNVSHGTFMFQLKVKCGCRVHTNSLACFLHTECIIRGEGVFCCNFIWQSVWIFCDNCTIVHICCKGEEISDTIVTVSLSVLSFFFWSYFLSQKHSFFSVFKGFLMSNMKETPLWFASLSFHTIKQFYLVFTHHLMFGIVTFNLI